MTGYPALFRVQQPAAVAAACYLLAGVAALRVVAAVAAFYAAPEFDWTYSERYSDAGRGHSAALGITLLGVCSLVLAVAYLFLALVQGSRKNRARVAAWIVGGVTIVGTAILLARDATGVAWYTRLTTQAAWLTLAFVGAALVLLALPSAHWYYRPGIPNGPIRYVRPRPTRRTGTRRVALIAGTISAVSGSAAFAIVVGLLVDPPADGYAVVAIAVGVVILTVPAVYFGRAAYLLWRRWRA